MEILEAYDLAGSLRGAAELAGCDHKTVAHWVAQRDLGLVPKLERKRPAMELEYQRKVDELVARSHGRFGGMSRTASWSRSGTSGRRGRRGGGSLRPSVGGGVSMDGSRDRGRRSLGCGRS